MSSFTLGHSDADHITVHLQQILPGDSTNLSVRVELQIGGFSANYAAEFAAYYVHQLHTDLQVLYQTLTGPLEFHTFEEQLEFEITGDGRGHFKLVGTAQDRHASDNQLNFRFDFDQTSLPATLRDLEIMAEQIKL